MPDTLNISNLGFQRTLKKEVFVRELDYIQEKKRKYKFFLQMLIQALLSLGKTCQKIRKLMLYIKM